MDPSLLDEIQASQAGEARSLSSELAIEEGQAGEPGGQGGSFDNEAENVRQTRRRSWLQEFVYEERRPVVNEEKVQLLVVASLFATICFPFGILAPSQFKTFFSRDDSASVANRPAPPQDNDREAKLRDFGIRNMVIFLIIINIVFSLSLTIVADARRGLPHQWKLRISIILLMLAYSWAQAHFEPIGVLEYYGVLLSTYIVPVFGWLIPSIARRIGRLIGRVIEKED